MMFTGWGYVQRCGCNINLCDYIIKLQFPYLITIIKYNTAISTVAFCGVILMENKIIVSTQGVENENSMTTLDSIQRLSEITRTVADSVAKLFSQEFQESLKVVKNAIEASCKRISENLGPMLKQFSEALIPFRYIQILQESKWPLFLICDDEFRQKVISEYDSNPTSETIRQLAFGLCSDEFMDALQRDWSICPALPEDRKPILNEALLMYKQGYYYACTSILMCQVYGVASDTFAIVKKNHLELDDEMKDFTAEQFSIRREDIDKEKGRLLQTVMMTESGQLLFEAMADYLQKEILCSSDSKKRWATQPLRNKICHGDQLNFGTKEHSLKAILTIDMLIQLAYEIERIAKLKQNDETTHSEQTSVEEGDFSTAPIL